MLPHHTHDRLIALDLVGMAKAFEEQRRSRPLSIAASALPQSRPLCCTVPPWAGLMLLKVVHENRVRNSQIEKACLSNQHAPAAVFLNQNCAATRSKSFFEQNRPTLQFSCAKRRPLLFGVDEGQVNDMRQFALFGAPQWSPSCR